MKKEELIELLRLILRPPLGTTEEEHNELILKFNDNVPNPSGYNTIVDIQLSLTDIEESSNAFNNYIEAVVEKALNYRPIIL